MALSVNTSARIGPVWPDGGNTTDPLEWLTTEAPALMVAVEDANNPLGSFLDQWQIMIVVRRVDTGEIVGKRHVITADRDPYFDHALIFDEPMGSDPIQFTVELWAHDEPSEPVPAWVTKDMG